MGTITLKYKDDDLKFLPVDGMVRITDLVCDLWDKMSLQDVTTENAETHLWVREAAESMLAIKRAAEYAALEMYYEVMVSPAAQETMERVRQMKPCTTPK